MEVFVAVAEEEGFNAAARKLRISPPSVTRAIGNLEDRLGVKLLDRTTRFVRPTPAGLRYLEDSRRLLAELQAADDAVAGVHTDPHGHLAITAPVLFGRMHVMPLIVEYLETYPETEVSALFLDRIVSLVEEGLDVGIRIGQLPDSTLQARKVGEVRHLLCASPDYLQRNGAPRDPTALRDHTLISSAAGGFTLDWQFRQRDRTTGIRVHPRLIVTTNDAAIEAAVEGFGIVRTLSYQAASAVDAGQLQILLEDFEPPPEPVHILHREGKLATPRVRAFIDLAAERLPGNPALAPE